MVSSILAKAMAPLSPMWLWNRYKKETAELVSSILAMAMAPLSLMLLLVRYSSPTRVLLSRASTKAMIPVSPMFSLCRSILVHSAGTVAVSYLPALRMCFKYKQLSYASRARRLFGWKQKQRWLTKVFE